MTANNVLQFPSIKKINPKETPTLEGIDESIRSMKLYHITEAMQAVMPTIFNMLLVAGFDFVESSESEHDPFMKDGSLVAESIRSLLCKYYGLAHPVQSVAESLFVEDEDGLEISSRIDIEISTKIGEALETDYSVER